MEILTWQARVDKNITLKQLEAMTGISKTTLNYIENGVTSPTLRQLEAIAAALDILTLYRRSCRRPTGYLFPKQSGKDEPIQGSFIICTRLSFLFALNMILHLGIVP